jgi:hypothetical protein
VPQLESAVFVDGVRTTVAGRVSRGRIEARCRNACGVDREAVGVLHEAAQRERGRKLDLERTRRIERQRELGGSARETLCADEDAVLAGR